MTHRAFIHEYVGAIFAFDLTASDRVLNETGSKTSSTPAGWWWRPARLKMRSLRSTASPRSPSSVCRMKSGLRHHGVRCYHPGQRSERRERHRACPRSSCRVQDTQDGSLRGSATQEYGRQDLEARSA